MTIAGQEYSTAEMELDLSGMGLTDADLVNLGQMENLVSLNLLGNSEISDLTPLAGLTKLESLTLPSPSAIQDLSPLSGLTNLRELDMSGDWGEATPFTEVKDLSPLSGLTNLTQLKLTVTGLEDLSFLSGLSQLMELRLVGSVTAKDLTALSGLTNLRELKIHTDGLASFQGMENLTQLESADFFGDNATYTDVDPLKNLAKLRYLRLPMHSDSSGIVFNGDGLAGMESLQELDMEMRI